jgi:hypothetical protein
LTRYSARIRSHLVSCGWRPWVSGFQRFSLSGSGEYLATSLPFMLFLTATFRAGKPTRRPRRRSSKGLRNRRVRFDKHGVTRRMPTDPLLALPLFEVFTSLASTPCFHGISSHGLLRLAERRTAHRDVCSAEFQRTRKLACLFREPPTSMRFSSSTFESRRNLQLRTS